MECLEHAVDDEALAVDVEGGQLGAPRSGRGLLQPVIASSTSHSSTWPRFDDGSVDTSRTRRPRSANATAVAVASDVLPAHAGEEEIAWDAR
jgi:hypothetical protein